MEILQWNIKGQLKSIYAFGIPEYQDIDSWLESGKYREIDEKAYRKIRSGIFSDEESVLEFVSVISSQYVKMHRGVCSEIFHNISMRLFRNGMFLSDVDISPHIYVSEGQKKERWISQQYRYC